MRGHVVELSLHTYGCRVVQKALDFISAEATAELAAELEADVSLCIKDQNANHVLQKMVISVGRDVAAADGIAFIRNVFIGKVAELAVHCYSCRVLQRVLENSTEEQTRTLVDEVHALTKPLMQDQYGNYVIQWILQDAPPKDSERVVRAVKGDFVELARHKFASNVLETVVAIAATKAMPGKDVGEHFSELVDEILEPIPAADAGLAAPEGEVAVTTTGAVTMMNHSFANYVLQKMVQVAPPADKARISDAIRSELKRLRSSAIGNAKNLVAIEKLLDAD